MEVIIKSNDFQNEPVLIRDLGMLIPPNGGSEGYTGIFERDHIRLSVHLRELCNDRAFGLSGSTLSVNDGTAEVSTEQLDYFISTVCGFAGGTGTNGPTGGFGGPGETGPRGFTGLVGSTGWQGLTGSSGQTGAQGLTGFGGSTGLEGSTGWQGETGSAGVGTTGLSGDTGLEGPAGWQGLTGLEGTTGAQGYTGLGGSTGLQGTTGSAGLTGSQGLTGADGYTGLEGPTGLMGHTGSQGLTGARGDTGIEGPTGLMGHTGSRGDTGSQGYTGLGGPTGWQGLTGSGGQTGSQGYTGVNGVTGLTGSTGLQGLTGAEGHTGAQGFTGPVGGTGLRGPTGFQGHTGSQGQTGAQGFTGLRGITGISGPTGSNGSDPSYGDMHIDAGIGGTGLDMPTALTYYLIQHYSYSNTSSTITANTTNGTFTVGPQGSGEYEISFSINFSGASNTYFRFNIFKNGSIVIGSESYLKPSSANVPQSISNTCLEFLNAGDVVDIRISANTNNNVPLFYFSSFILHRVGGYVSPQGETGLGGFTGLMGQTGSQGLTGPSGVGTTGLSGVTGSLGPTGSQGLTGPAGAGFTGLPGVTGFQGVTGATFRRYQYYADQFDYPRTADWRVNAYAPLAADTNNNALLVRRFDDTTEEGVGFILETPSNASNLEISFRSRAQTPPAVTRDVIPKLYVRRIPDYASGYTGVLGWSTGTTLNALSFFTGANWYYDAQSIPFSTLGITGAELNQFELTRDATNGGDNLVGDWALLIANVTFS